MKVWKTIEIVMIVWKKIKNCKKILEKKTFEMVFQKLH